MNRPTEITAAEGNLFVVNQSNGKTGGEYITKYDANTGLQVGGKLIQGLHGPIQIAVSGNDLFVTNISQKTIDKYDATTGGLLKSGFITGLHNPTDVTASNEPLMQLLFVTDASNRSIDVYNVATGKPLPALTITGLDGRPQGIDVVPGQTTSVPDLSASCLLMLISLGAILGLRISVR